MPDTVITVTKANDGSKNVISAVTVENTGSGDTSIVVPSDAANYMDLSSLTTFADSLMKTADLKTISYYRYYQCEYEHYWYSD